MGARAARGQVLTRKRAWKTTEVEYLRQHYVKDGADAVAKALGRTRNSVVHAASTYGASRQHHAATLEGIKARCVTEGDCWLWQGASDGHGRANMRRDGRSVPVRRVVRELVDGQPIPTGKRVAAKCWVKECVSPECSVIVSHKVALRMAAKRGAYGNLSRTMKGMATKRASAKFSEDVIALVRAQPGTSKEAAAANGMSVSHAKAIRRGVARASFGAYQLRRAT